MVAPHRTRDSQQSAGCFPESRSTVLLRALALPFEEPALGGAQRTEALLLHLGEDLVELQFALRIGTLPTSLLHRAGPAQDAGEEPGRPVQTRVEEPRSAPGQRAERRPAEVCRVRDG